MQMGHNISGFWTKVHQIFSHMKIFLLTVLMQQFVLRSVHLLLNDDI